MDAEEVVLVLGEDALFLPLVSLLLPLFFMTRRWEGDRRVARDDIVVGLWVGCDSDDKMVTMRRKQM